MTNNYREWLQAAKQAMESNGNDLGRWEAETLVVWLSDNCSCAYCKKSLLADRDTTYFGQQIDHVLPTSKHPEINRDELSNWALACAARNRLKRAWDPNGGTDEFNSPPIKLLNPSQLSSTERLDFILRAHNYLDKKRAALEVEFEKEVQVISALLSTVKACGA